MNPQQAFMDLLIAAMLDAATSMSLTQFKTTITPDDGRQRTVRIIVVPEEMEYARKDHKPLGTTEPDAIAEEASE